MKAVILWFALTAQEAPPPELPPEAAAFNERGIALVDAGRFAEGIDELERAYAAMPDPLKYRVGRGMIAGSLRSALTRLYQTTGATAHLCRLRGILHRHRTELLAALGASGRSDEVAGTDGAIAEIDATLAGRPCEAPPTGAPAPQVEAPRTETPPVAPTVRPEPPPLHPPGETSGRARRARGVGGALLGVGGLAAIGAASAAGIYADRFRRLDALDPDRELDGPDEVAEWSRLHSEGRQARVAAAVTGSVAGVLIVAGVAVLVRGSRAPKRVSVAPTVTGHAWGLQLAGRF